MAKRTIGGVALFLIFAGMPVGGAEPVKRALVIGLDGVRPDALMAAETPRLDRLIESGTYWSEAFAGGVASSPSEQKTSSGPGWSSILTGVWVDRHRVKDNSFSFNRLAAFPHFYKRLKEVKEDAVLGSAVSWGPIEDQIVKPVAEVFDFHVKGKGENYAAKDESVIDQTVAYLQRADPDVMMVHLDQIDGAGHGTGFSAENDTYLKAISAVDGLVGRLLDAISQRAENAEEDWLVVVTTDHGGLGKGHGGNSVDERRIFIIASRENAVAEKRGEAIGHVAVPGIVMGHLGLEVSREWGWEVK